MAVSYITGGKTQNTSVSTSNVVSSLANVQAGDLMLLAVCFPNNTSTVTSVTDSRGDHHWFFLGRGSNGSAVGLEVWGAIANGAVTSITASFASIRNFAVVNVYRGVTGFLNFVIPGANRGAIKSTTGGASPASLDNNVRDANNWNVAFFTHKSTATYTIQNGTMEVAQQAGASTYPGGCCIHNTNATAGQNAPCSATMSASTAWAGMLVELCTVLKLVGCGNVAACGGGV